MHYIFNIYEMILCLEAWLEKDTSTLPRSKLPCHIIGIIYLQYNFLESTFPQDHTASTFEEFWGSIEN